MFNGPHYLWMRSHAMIPNQNPIDASCSTKVCLPRACSHFHTKLTIVVSRAVVLPTRRRSRRRSRSNCHIADHFARELELESRVAARIVVARVEMPFSQAVNLDPACQSADRSIMLRRSVGRRLLFEKGKSAAFGRLITIYVGTVRDRMLGIM